MWLWVKSGFHENEQGPDLIRKRHITSISNPIVEIVETILQPSCLHYGIPYTSMMMSLYGISPHNTGRRVGYGIQRDLDEVHHYTRAQLQYIR